MSENIETTVVVTGASGFVGAHVVKQLLQEGYSVRATVRDASNETKTQFIRDLAEDKPGKLSLFSADLLNDGSFDEAMDGAVYVIHTAAAVMLHASDPQKEIVDVTVNGTKNVLQSCAKAGTIRKYVHTSSIAAIQDLNRPDDHVYSEEDYNISATVKDDAYSVSKYQSEKLVKDFIDELPEEKKFVYCFVNPGAIYGPILVKHHLSSSPTLVYELMTGKVPMIPHLNFPAVDVRDVAKMQIMCMTKEDIPTRFVCVQDNYSMKDIAKKCKEEFPKHKFPSRGLPNMFMYLAAVFDKRMTFSFLKNNLNKVRTYTNARAVKELGFTFTDVGNVTLKDTCQSFIDLGLVEAK